MSKMSFIGGFSANNYYQGTNLGINDQTYTIGAVVVAGHSTAGADSETIMSCLASNAGYELRTVSGDYRLCFQGQAGVNTITQPQIPNLPVSDLSRVLFVVMSATADSQVFYINGQLVAQSYGSAIAISASNFRIGCDPAGAYPGTNLLLNMCFYTNDDLSAAEIQTVYRWLQAYGRIPDNGLVAGSVTIDHFWDLIDNRDAIQTTWTSRGATGAKALTRAGTCTIASTGTATWGW